MSRMLGPLRPKWVRRVELVKDLRRLPEAARSSTVAGMVMPDGQVVHPFGEAPADAGLGADTIASLPLDPAVVAASDAGTPIETGSIAAGLDTVAARIATQLTL